MKTVQNEMAILREEQKSLVGVVHDLVGAIGKLQATLEASGSGQVAAGSESIPMEEETAKGTVIAKATAGETAEETRLSAPDPAFDENPDSMSPADAMVAAKRLNNLDLTRLDMLVRETPARNKSAASKIRHRLKAVLLLMLECATDEQKVMIERKPDHTTAHNHVTWKSHYTEMCETIQIQAEAAFAARYDEVVKKVAAANAASDGPPITMGRVSRTGQGDATVGSLGNRILGLTTIENKLAGNAGGGKVRGAGKGKKRPAGSGAEAKTGALDAFIRKKK